jgi:hypothetical protein
MFCKINKHTDYSEISLQENQGQRVSSYLFGIKRR